MDIARYLLDNVNASTAPIRGPICDQALRLPVCSADGRALTWEKLFKRLVFVNKPQSIDDCWLMEPTLQDGTVGAKLSKDGSRNKWKMHRVLYAVCFPDAHPLVENRDASVHFAHRCGRGIANGANTTACVNPHHIKLVTASENQDDKGCKYGHQALCPHTPHCIWTWPDSGKLKQCFNQPELAKSCTCERKCSHKTLN